jgi:DNA-binding NtrC family response regulator
MKILVVDDEMGIVETLEVLFRGAGYEVETALGGRAGLEALERMKPDLVLSDIRMPGVTGLELLERIRETDPELPVILMTAQASLQSAVKAVNEGAFYYLQKPFSNDELLAICARALENRVLKVENRTLRKELKKQSAPVTTPIGKARPFADAMKLAKTVAPTDSTVLVTGESGTGKEVLARYMHELSDRADGPFLSINCGALPESLLESELFGHTKGSFTGAVKDRDGLLVAAEGGTFFLDEVGEMSPQTQVKLLRALQEREVIPVGATKSVPVNVRIIAATNRDLEEQIRKGHFRSDLYYRLNVIAVHLPPLRERKDDIPMLSAYFLQKMAGGGPEPKILSDEAVAALSRYDWPGNVRELENALERAAVLTGDPIPRSPLGPPRSGPGRAPKERLVSEIPRTTPPWRSSSGPTSSGSSGRGGNKSRAAEVLGIDPSTLYRKIARYGLGEG